MVHETPPKTINMTVCSYLLKKTPEPQRVNL